MTTEAFAGTLHAARASSAPAPAPATVVETHVSVLLFTGDLTLKFKKAVRFPFVDFTRRPGRLAACLAEVEVNRRLSPDVYLGVADLRLEVPGAEGATAREALDHAVVMRRLPAERSLDHLVAVSDAGVGAGLAAVAGRLAEFHHTAARGPEIDADARAEAVNQTWRRCLDTLEPFAGKVVEAHVLADVERMALAYLAGRAPLLELRVVAGRVCDGHGDLLASDVFLLDDGPRILDAVEFDARLRHVDVAADVAFLAMDLERLGAPDLARLFLERYQDAAGDTFPPTLLEHYLAQRATVRAQVSCLRAEQLGDSDRAASEASAAQARGLLEAARAHLRAGRVVLGVVSGLPGTGKSTLAAALGDRLGWTVLGSDEIRAELVAPAQRQPLTATRFPNAYQPGVTDQVYATLLHRAQTALALGRPVLLDATFADPRMRRSVEELATRTSSGLVVLRCEAPTPLAAARLDRRLAAGCDLSGADPEVLAALIERGGAAPWPGAVPIDTTRPVDEQLRAALGAMDGA